MMIQDIVRLFGVREGLSFWARWFVVYSVQNWYWYHFTDREWCTDFEWSCKRLPPNCKGDHILSRLEIDEHMDEMAKEELW